MAISSINIQPASNNPTLHNHRVFDVAYAVKDESENEYLSIESITQKRNFINEDYKNFHKQKMQKTATPIREAIVNLNAEHTMQDVKNLCKVLEDRYKIKALDISIHRDEGHLDKNNNEVLNLHAHIVFSWYNEETHTSIKLNRKDMQELQTLTAETLHMKRGEEDSKKIRLSHQQYKRAMQIADEEVEQVTKNYEYNFRTMQKRITALEDVSKEDKKELHKLNTQVNKKTAKIEELEEKIKELENREPVEKVVEVSKEDDLKKIEELQEQLQKRKEEADQRENYLKSMHFQALKAKDDELETLREENDTLEQEKSSNTQYISNLEDELREFQREEKEANIETREIFEEHKIFRMQSVSSIVSFLKDKYLKLKDKIKDLTKENDTLKAENEELKSKVSAAPAEEAEALKIDKDGFAEMMKDLKAKQKTQKKELK